MIQVLLVEDDKEIARIIKYYLGMEDCYEIFWAKTAQEALEQAHGAYDIILLDIMLPDTDGVSLCAQLRKHHHCPIIFVSCLDDSDTIISALDQGGDDYIVKPFDNKVLHARIRANLRRVSMDNEEKINNLMECAGFRLDASGQTLEFQDRTIPLAPMEYRIMAYFMRYPGKHFKSGELYRMLWGRPSYGDTRTVIVHIYNLRKKIEKDPANPKYLINDWGKGYVFLPEGV